MYEIAVQNKSHLRSKTLASRVIEERTTVTTSCSSETEAIFKTATFFKEILQITSVGELSSVHPLVKTCSAI